ncbi:hypothetical protein ASD08_44210 [Streptomyces sp. Root369]|nr:hypothetical protein ASD08_44210 [Streptomyces sp. Root369]
MLNVLHSVVVFFDPVVRRSDHESCSEAVRILDPHRDRSLVIHVDTEMEAPVSADARTATRHELGQRLPPCREVLRGEIHLQSRVDEARGHQDVSAQDVVAGQYAGLEATGRAHNAAIAVRVLQVDQVHCLRLRHSWPRFLALVWWAPFLIGAP